MLAGKSLLYLNSAFYSGKICHEGSDAVRDSASSPAAVTSSCSGISHHSERCDPSSAVAAAFQQCASQYSF